MYKKKSLGQHFLGDTHILQKIVAAANFSPEDTVLEVGPGEGTLTKLLLEQAGKVVAVEKDDRLIPILQEKFRSDIAAERLVLIHADVLKNYTTPSSSTPDVEEEYKIVANLPYYITGQFLRKFLQEAEHPPVQMTLLLQREVAKRIVAADKKESILSMSVKAYGTPRYIDTVKAGSFSPPPKVDSAILNIENISKKFFNTLVCRPRGSGGPETAQDALDSRLRGNDREKAFFELLKKGFAHPRKLLSSNLNIQPPFLQKYGIAEKSRAENLTLQDWRCLLLHGTAS